MILFEPIWLILMIPALVCLYYWRMPGRLLAVLRIILVALLILIMTDPALRLGDRRGTVVVIADRSASMPPDSQESMVEAIHIVQDDMPNGNSLAVVSFGEQAIIDKTPQSQHFEELIANVNPDGSNLADALNKAVSLIDRDASGRILVFSDGRWTGSSPNVIASTMASRHIAMDYRIFERQQGRDLAIMDVVAPQKVSPGQAWLINAWINCPEPVEVNYELIRGNLIIGRGSRPLKSGLNRLTFRDRAGDYGVYDYQLKIDGYADDPVAQNNYARFLTQIDVNRPLLALGQTGQSGLVNLLQKDGIPVVRQETAEMGFTLDELAGYSAILIEDLDAGEIGPGGMENIAAWVTDTGAGVIMTGGPHSYGPGGYFRSPLEPIMPVSMELRREHRKLNMAIVVVLDRSGSMSVSADGIKTKMDLANAASAEVLGLLSPGDEMGVIAVDSAAHIIADCKPIGENVAGLRQKILSIESTGGGIFVYEGLIHAASLLSGAESETKHIILFADAADSEEPGDYKNLIAKCRQAGVTVSVIGLGSEKDQDADLLRDIALRGEGRCFFTQNALDLPRLFAQDTFMVARNSFINEPVAFEFKAGIDTLMDIDTAGDHRVGGYNLCYIRPEATLSAVTLDGYDAPILAHWQAGIGRAAAFCAQADGNYAGQLAQWSEAGRLYSSLARWAIGDPQGLGQNILVTQEINKGICQVQIHIDSRLDRLPFSEPPVVNVLRERPGREPAREQLRSTLISADKFAVDIPLSSDKTVLATVDAGATGNVTLPPVCLPYSPEYLPEDAVGGQETLQRLSRMTGGGRLADLTGIWDSLEGRPVYVDMTPWLAMVAIVLFLLEILERRTGVLSMRPVKRWLERRKAKGLQPAVALESTEESTETEKRVLPVKPKRGYWDILSKVKIRHQSSTEQKAESSPRKDQQPITKPVAPPQPTEADSGEGLLDALNKIKRKH